MAAAAALSAAPGSFFQSLKWTAPGSQLAALTQQPPVCLVHDPVDFGRVRAGMALFHTPTLLGGQAAKAGLNCASCHVNGRDNPHFLLPSLSGAPGTADVTNSFFGAARGNARHDPAVIPDLALPGKVSRAAGDPALPRFIRDLIVEEFSGAEPDADMLAALSAYVRAVRPCSDGDIGAATGVQTLRLVHHLSIVRAALDSVAATDGGRSSMAKSLLIAGARHQLGLIAERYAGPRFAAERRMLLRASMRLRAISDIANSADFAAAARQWQRDFDRKIAPRLAAGEDASLYQTERLSAFLVGNN